MNYGCLFGDLDNNGTLDLYVVNNNTQNSLFMNQGDGTFIQAPSGVGVGGPSSDNLSAVAFDEENDGDLDLFVTNSVPGANSYFESLDNNTNFVRVIAWGTDSSRDAVGALIALGEFPGTLKGTRQVTAGSGYGSMNPLTAHFGGLVSGTTMGVLVTFPTTRTSFRVFTETGQTLIVREQGRVFATDFDGNTWGAATTSATSNWRIGAWGPGRVTSGVNSLWCGANITTWVSPPGYGNNWDERFTISNIDLRYFSAAALTFMARSDLENGMDYGYIEVSDNGGASWTVLESGKTGTDESMGYAEFDLSAYAGKIISLRFRVITDSSWSNEDGLFPSTNGAFYIDDINIYALP